MVERGSLILRLLIALGVKCKRYRYGLFQMCLSLHEFPYIISLDNIYNITDFKEIQLYNAVSYVFLVYRKLNKGL